ncbi:hypothetical protein EAG_07196 [Camponotus floridanus]|uniref:CCHC-type domain-containing protein n=1 Tax=Camponotus floridanus TaxID=104421 RepID=E2ASB9_CAMFO|nr:hypothetical protein EAG_07196 [Camponotus floridanus]
MSQIDKTRGMATGKSIQSGETGWMDEQIGRMEARLETLGTQIFKVFDLLEDPANIRKKGERYLKRESYFELANWRRDQSGTLPIRPLRARWSCCLCCLECGYLAVVCKEADRSGHCHRCSDPTHRARECKTDRPRCSQCLELGLPSLHTRGSQVCVPDRRTAQMWQRERKKTRKEEYAQPYLPLNESPPDPVVATGKRRRKGRKTNKRNTPGGDRHNLNNTDWLKCGAALSPGISAIRTA